MMEFTDSTLRDLLASVGLPSQAGDGAAERTFDELGLDSLARVELATRIEDRFGVDVEDRITEHATPSEVRELVNQRLTAVTR
ncbi:acyl carrier protein [Nonomuraea endophytica]|uniref:acyl carrier protein n=1 Tax=Nonomuraea endophytica TaxID=714136 RepID=UPI0037CA8EFF